MKKHILLTGGTGGIGKAITNLLIGHNFHVFVCDIDRIELEKIGQPHVSPFFMDITDSASVQQTFEKISERIPALEGIINNAGLFDRFALVEASPKRVEKLVYANLLGHQFVTQKFFSLLLKNKGRIINISSESALVPLPLLSYGLSKRLFDSWTYQLRQELHLLDMHVSIIRPGGHQTPFFEKTIRIMEEVEEGSLFRGILMEMRRQSQSLLAKRQNDPNEVAKAVLKALTEKHPKREYWVNVSGLYKFLYVLPAGIRSRIIAGKLKKMMNNQVKQRQAQ